MAEILDFCSNDGVDWDEFVERSPQGTVFAKSFWLRAFAESAKGHKGIAIVARDKNGCIEAGLPLFVVQKGLSKSAVIPPLTAYTSLLLQPRAGTDQYVEVFWLTNVLGDLLAEVERLRLREIMLKHAPELVDVREFAWAGWHVGSQYTYVNSIDALDPEAVMSKNTGKNYRKAKRNGYTISRVDDIAGHLDEFLDIFRYSYKTVPKSYLSHCQVVRSQCTSRQATQYARLYEARDADGRLQAARIVWLSAHGKVMDWGAATTDVGRKDGATFFIIVEMFRDLQAMGCKSFDFCGANMRPIAHFKSGFNGKLVSYHTTSIEQPRFSRDIRALTRTALVKMGLWKPRKM